jgi:hypothetical protein
VVDRITSIKRTWSGWIASRWGYRLGALKGLSTYGCERDSQERGGQVGFAVEPCAKVGVSRDVGWQNLQCVSARQPGMLSEVDLAHSSGPQQPDNGVPRKGLTATQRHGRIVGATRGTMGCNHHAFAATRE